MYFSLALSCIHIPPLINSSSQSRPCRSFPYSHLLLEKPNSSLACRTPGISRPSCQLRLSPDVILPSRFILLYPSRYLLSINPRTDPTSPLLLQPPFPTIVQLPSLLTLPSPFHTSLIASLSQSFHYRFNPAKITLSIYKFLQNTSYTTSLE